MTIIGIYNLEYHKLSIKSKYKKWDFFFSKIAILKFFQNVANATWKSCFYLVLFYFQWLPGGAENYLWCVGMRY